MTTNSETRTDPDRLAELMEAALQIEGDARDRFIDERCAGEAALAQELRSLLASHDLARPFLSPQEIGPHCDALLDGSERAGSFQIVEKIGEGGFGEVYRARQTSPVQREVAIKVIRAGMDSKQVIARFEAERQALAMMHHPNIANVFEAGVTTTGRLFVVMELVAGEPLTTHCDRAHLSIRQRLAIFRQICLAVQHAHSKGIIHRDLKPTNVLVTLIDGEPVPKVIDFGIAKAAGGDLASPARVTALWQAVGTPEYMSPEQADLDNPDIDTRSDIYSLGVLLFELLTGATPHDRARLKSKSWSELQRAIREDDAVRPSSLARTLAAECPEIAARRRHDPRHLSRALRGELDWIAAKALARDRNRRYATASALAEDIQRFLNHEGVSASPPSAVYAFRKFVRRHAVAASFVAAAAIALAFGGATLLLSLKRIETERDDAVAATLSAEQARLDAEAALSFLAQMLSAGDPMTYGREVSVREMLDDVSRSIEAVFAGNSDARCRVLLTLGTTYLGIGQLTEAERHLLDAFESARALHGDAGQQTLDARIQLGILHRRQARYDDAERDLEGALELARANLGSRHGTTIRAVAALGALRYYQGRTSEAESGLTAALAGAVALLGAEHPETIGIMENLAEVHAALGRVDNALALNQEIIAILTRRFDPEHPRALLARSKLSQRYITMHRYAEAEELLTDVSAACDRVLGPDHPHSLEAASKLGSASVGLGKLDVAESLFERVYERRRSLLSEDHPETMAALNNLASVHLARGDFGSAEPLFLRAISVIEQVDGPAHQRTLIAKYNLARLYLNTSRFAEAEPLLAQVVEAAGATPGPGPDFLPASLNHYGRCLVGLERFAEAEPSLVRAYELFHQARGPQHEYTLGAIRSIIALYQKWDRLDLAAEWQVRLTEAAGGPASVPGATSPNPGNS
jgi:non-specific serine/threonine protein kinase/serine/threonine-protein kinase